MHLSIYDIEPDHPHIPHRAAVVEVAAHLRDGASEPTIDWSRLAHVAGLHGLDLEVDLELIRTGPTPRANLRRFALAFTA